MLKLTKSLTLRAPRLEKDLLPDVKPTGDVEADSKTELTEAMKLFKAQAKAEDARKMEVTDSEYWCCLCFASREQKDAFLAAMNWADLGDKYLDGTKAAEKSGVALPAPPKLVAIKRRGVKAVPLIREL